MSKVSRTPQKLVTIAEDKPCAIDSPYTSRLLVFCKHSVSGPSFSSLKSCPRCLYIENAVKIYPVMWANGSRAAATIPACRVSLWVSGFLPREHICNSWYRDYTRSIYLHKSTLKFICTKSILLFLQKITPQRVWLDVTGKNNQETPHANQEKENKNCWIKLKRRRS